MQASLRTPSGVLIIPQGKSIIISVTENDRISFVGECHQIIGSKITAGETIAPVMIIPRLTSHLNRNQQAEKH